MDPAVPGPGDGLLFTHPKNPHQEYGFSLNTAPVQKDGEIAIKGFAQRLNLVPECSSPLQQILKCVHDR